MIIPQPKSPLNDILEIKSVTWSKVSHGLFDYESSTFMIKKFHIQESHYIYRKGQDHEISVEEKLLDPQPNCTFLTKINFNDEKKFEVLQRNPSNAGESKNFMEEVFIIVRSLKNKNGQQKGYALETGDVMKLGRVEYLILECNDSNSNKDGQNRIYNTFCEEWQYKYDNIPTEESSKKTCRICLSDDEALDDSNLFFISPCECKGSCKYVHFACLKSWINSKVIKKEIGNTTNFLWKKFECEVCEKQYPKHILFGNKRYDLVHIEFPNGPYLLLENISREKRKSKGLTLIRRPAFNKELKEEDKETRLGRGHQCNLRITDISVSRLHAIIKYENDRFLLFDNNSKFGTLVLLKNAMTLSEEKIAVQIGRTVISFSLKNMAVMKSLIEKKNSEFLSAEKDKIENKNEEKETNEMFFKKQEEILNKSGDEMDKINHEEEDQDI